MNINNITIILLLLLMVQWKGLDVDHHKIVWDNDWVEGFDEKIKYDMSLYLEEFEIEDGDVVVDLGASTGLFTLVVEVKSIQLNLFQKC